MESQQGEQLAPKSKSTLTASAQISLSFAEKSEGYAYMRAIGECLFDQNRGRRFVYSLLINVRDLLMAQDSPDKGDVSIASFSRRSFLQGSSRGLRFQGYVKFVPCAKPL